MCARMKIEPLEDEVRSYCLGQYGNRIGQLTFTNGTDIRRGTCAFYGWAGCVCVWQGSGCQSVAYGMCLLLREVFGSRKYWGWVSYDNESSFL